MQESGYIAFTTAKRADCMQSFSYFLDLMNIFFDKSERFPSFAELIEQPQWATDLLTVVQRHRSRGITTAMFLGCFKTFLHALDDTVSATQADAQTKSQALFFIHRLADAYELLIATEWQTANEQKAIHILDDANRKLALEKCRYENILSAISEPVFILDPQGRVVEANKSATRYFSGHEFLNAHIWEICPVGVNSMSELLHKIEASLPSAIRVQLDYVSFEITLVSLKTVSLATDNYLLVLNDVSTHIQQKEVLENLVSARTDALAKEKYRLEEMNITLKNVLKTIEQQNEESFSSRLKRLKSQVFPLLLSIKKEKSKEARDAFLEIMEKQLVSICSDHVDTEDVILSSELTPVELKVCHMLRDGLSTKSISHALNLSVETIHTHRRNIRRKLGLIGKNISIFNYLNSKELP